MSRISVRPEIQRLDAYAPGLSIAEIRRKYGLDQVIKMASNENPLGAPPLAQEVVRRYAAFAFRYPQGGNPRLVAALAALHSVEPARIVVGNGSDEIIDMLIRMLAEAGRHVIVCFEPCFSIYPIQGGIAGVQLRRCPLRKDFSFNFDALLNLVNADTRLVFVSTPDNPSGYCPPRAAVRDLARQLADHAPDCLLVIDEAYMDFADDENASSLLAAGDLPENTAFLRTFSKSYGLAGLRLGYGVLPPVLAKYYWRTRLPFSVNIPAEEAGLAALADTAFRQATLTTVHEGRALLRQKLTELGCTVWPSSANFLLFQLPEGTCSAQECFEALLKKGVIIRPLSSYGLQEHLRVSVGNPQENAAFLAALRDILASSAPDRDGKS
ncbi:histidinol-phosphate transaminase [Candidatus Desulfovibrio trichonymphae]|uniref:Histidinol-phosphate aminotransferase n=1 Tax=Candidatus Desulfovibrio trichonymphae TaxID=1725232 RepID=A0A1J1DPA7_9BACT|nr:histidinol-phosphate transaminase [Candidatus Desulfovibrio trichonymphae]BAV91673.1 histidinol-phosphate aminotransferase [Candidatus Desulfovibrio trichonymphae]GHU98305.1 histidinol-phosphate aminotransferase [Deltaproteobacteria bacterium]